MLTLAIPSFSNLIAASRAKTAASDVYLAIAKARSEAVKQNQNITLTFASSTAACGGAGTWQLTVGGAVGTTYCLRKGLSVTGPASITYQSSGRLQGTATQNFQITASAPTPANRCVVIDPSGRLYIKASTCA